MTGGGIFFWNEHIQTDDVAEASQRAMLYSIQYSWPAEQNGFAHFVVQMKDAWCSSAVLSTIVHLSRILFYVPHCAFIVYLASFNESMAVLQDNRVKFIGQYDAKHKISRNMAGCDVLTVMTTLSSEAAVKGSKARFRSFVSHVEHRFRSSSIIRASGRVLTLKTNKKECEGIAWSLAQLQEVHWIECSRPRTKRNQFSKTSLTPGNLPYNLDAIFARGINGSGEVVHLADSGIDVDHCFFRDSQRTLVFNKVDREHRKLLVYWTGKHGDAFDSIGGHGTHVAGTIGGSLEEDTWHPLANFSGIAPACKLAFTDAEKQTASDGDGNFLLDDIPNSIYLKPYEEAGARVHSHSWGTQDFSYTVDAQELDDFIYRHPDAFFAWAAGNDGEQERFTLIASPASAKNCLSVGATFAALDSSLMAKEDGGEVRPSLCPLLV
eukprot:373680-Hanusia_phi.AAC.6